MLPRDFKFHIANETGVTIEFNADGANNTFTITARPWKLAADGALSYRAEQTWFADPTAADLTDGSSLEAASAVANGTNLDMGATLTAALLTDAATDGQLNIYWEASTDGGTTYPSDANDFAITDLQLIGVIALGTTTEDRTINIEL